MQLVPTEFRTWQQRTLLSGTLHMTAHGAASLSLLHNERGLPHGSFDTCVGLWSSIGPANAGWEQKYHSWPTEELVGNQWDAAQKPTRQHRQTRTAHRDSRRVFADPRGQQIHDRHLLHITLTGQYKGCVQREQKGSCWSLRVT
uniref:Uncharacterized protein n=1 Tax=Eutreptiella gymnastica TaxID=73025 RepID=A0A7S4GAD2_9EUGL|mmetsp:Transcript_64202/g.107370  ORF Transcript_64202/g.107370 Transcript_64202/m.107370 type:complete len:144 (-) Transcript_64202:467-898(-)